MHAVQTHHILTRNMKPAAMQTHIIGLTPMHKNGSSLALPMTHDMCKTARLNIAAGQYSNNNIAPGFATYHEMLKGHGTLQTLILPNRSLSPSFTTPAPSPFNQNKQ